MTHLLASFLLLSALSPAATSRWAASESMVLIKNDGVLPLAAGAKVMCSGGGVPADAAMRNSETSDRFLKHGGGSSTVFSPPVVDVPTGLADAGFTVVEEADIAVVTVTRFAAEGRDRPLEDWYLSADEKATLEKLKKAGRKIVVILNVGGVFDFSWIKEDPAISAALLVFFPGHEGGHAIADILSGKVNPSGRLADTVARDIRDYPASAAGFDRYRFNEYYEDGLYVGYRYFYTIPGAKEKVVYPFGHGLSYTTFSVGSGGEGRVLVRNTGPIAGKTSVLVYAIPPEPAKDRPRVDRPRFELKAFAKTKMLAPGESETLSIEVKTEDFAFFDEEGLYEKGAWVVEPGVYQFAAGGSPEDTTIIETRLVEAPIVVSKPGLKFTTAGGEVPRRLGADGRWRPTGVVASDTDDAHAVVPAFPAVTPSRPILLADVAEGRATMDAFLDQLTLEEMIALSRAQPTTFARGTAGFGNLEKYGVPIPQTADGPNGIRHALPQTCYPCASLVACSFDPAVGEAIGEAIAREAVPAGVDLLLAPALNIHRYPLCGRVFEYYSEDPVVSGKSAAAFVRGLQRGGTGATIKHFAVNGREFMRNSETMSIVPERALREIYLKGFEIAVKESQPWCVMTSYNGVNGYRTSINRALLEGVLRGEWGFTGAVMTDWSVKSSLWQEIEAGNNIKMPFDRSPAPAKEAVRRVRSGELSVAMVRASARHVLELVMKTRRFAKHELPTVTSIGNEPVTIPAMKVSLLSAISTLYEDDPSEGRVHAAIGKYWDGETDIALIYYLDVAEAGVYRIEVRHQGEIDGAAFDFEIDGTSRATAPVEAPERGWQTTSPVSLALTKGRHELRLFVRNGRTEKGAKVSWVRFSRQAPVKVVFDTDMYTDFDDAAALACLHALADRGECEILATVTSTRDSYSVAMCEIINAYYGRPEIPVGCLGAGGVTDGIATCAKRYGPTVEKYGKWVKHLNSSAAPKALDVYRQVLSAAPDHSVVICSVGFLSNLRDLLAAEPELVARKVRLYVAMACAYPKGREYNSMSDAAASRAVLEAWPTPIVFTDFQYGVDCYAGRVLADSALVDNPVADVFRGNLSSCNGPGGRSAWDETAVLIAVRGLEPYFGVERGTYRMVGSDGADEWVADSTSANLRVIEKMPKAAVGREIDALLL